MISAGFVSDMQRRVPETRCPSCGAPHLEFSLRCDLGGAECLFLARCSRCNSSFDLDPESFPPGLSADSLTDGTIACPACGDELAMVTLTRSTSSYSCRYALRCPSCDH
jgi:hypothetical protein